VTDLIPVDKIPSQVPIAMFVGKNDLIATPLDSELLREQIGGNVVGYKIVNGGHLSFMVGKDMSYFTEDVMHLLEAYHPLPKKQTNFFDFLM